MTAAPLTETTRRVADVLSLVSTQILRKVLKPGEEDKFGGFNPYDNN